MKKINLLVVDDSDVMVDALKEYFSINEKIDVKYTAYDGEEAVNMISMYKDDIDMILLDIVMPKKDGIYVLEKMKEMGISKKVIIQSSCDSNEMIHMAGKLGASYYMVKPYNVEDLEKRVLLINELSTPDANKIAQFVDGEIQSTITKLLHELGIPSHIKGYQYIREGIALLYEDPTMIGGITKELYPKLASKFDTTESRVERAMRHAIEVGWTRSDWKMTEDIFGQSVDFDRSKPTNSEFLVTLADKLRLDNNKVRI